MNLRHLAALSILRYQLSLNQQKKAGSANLIMSRIMRVLIFVVAILSFVLPIIFGPLLFQNIETVSWLKIWNLLFVLFLFCWAMMLVGQLQMNELIAVDRLLHLPISLNGAFLINYLSSFANFIMVMFAPPLLGFSLSAALTQGTKLWILLPATLAMLFMITSLTHQLRAKLANLMRNRRTRSIVVVAIPFVMVIGFLIFKVLEETIESRFDIPDLEIFDRLFSGWKPSWILVIGMVAVGLTSQFFSYRSLQKFYTGQEAKGANKKNTSPVDAWASANFLSQKLPLFSDTTSAVITSAYRNIVRAPEALMALVPIIVALLLGSPYLIGMEEFQIADYVRPWIQIGVVMIAMLGFPAFLFTCFSYDRDGFRAFILSPVNRQEILLGKNIAIWIPTFASGILMLILAQVSLHDHWTVFVASIIQLPGCYLLMCIIGNFLSVFFPVGLKRGSMQPANAPIISTIILYAGILLSPLLVVQPASLFIGLQMLVEGDFNPKSGWLYLILSCVQLAATLAIYRWSISYIGKELWNRETDILEVVSNIPE